MVRKARIEKANEETDEALALLSLEALAKIRASGATAYSEFTKSIDHGLHESSHDLVNELNGGQYLAYLNIGWPR